MTITAKIIADSIAPNGARLTTMQLRYPRFIHAEFMTHRNFSRNASSSRAIPFSKLVEDVQKDTAIPIEFGKNQAGMQAGENLEGAELINAQHAWCVARDSAVSEATKVHAQGVHKQIVNRIIEPFSHINVLVSATEYANFFALRRHKDAQPEIHELADRMWDAMQASKPNELGEGDWHLPYVTQKEIDWDLSLDEQIKVSIARCARVSYLTHDKKPTKLEDDLILFDRLLGSTPIHASPAEHVAVPCVTLYQETGNFIGWMQYRKTLENENIEQYDG